MKHKYSLFFAVSASALCACGQAMAAGPGGEGAALNDTRVVGLGFAAAVTMAFSVLGSGYAVARIGSAAMGAAAEKPELLIRSLLFVALAEGLAVLGFVIAMLLLQKI